MNHYPHHIGDFNTATRHLSRIERSVYRDMLDMYYDSETALDGSDMGNLARRLCCVTETEVAAMHYVLGEFFEQQDDGRWVHHRCERELAAYRAQQGEKKSVKQAEKTRQQRSREKRSAIFSALREAGASVAYNAKMVDLLEQCAKHGIDVAACVTGASHKAVTGDARHANDTAIQNQNQNQVNPPNPPAWGAVDCGVLVQTISLQFPEHRRTRLDEAEAEALAVLQSGEATPEDLIEGARRQSRQLCSDEGRRSCPSVLSWLRHKRWRDMPASPVTPDVAPVRMVTSNLTPEQLAANGARAREAAALARTVLGKAPAVVSQGVPA